MTLDNGNHDKAKVIHILQDTKQIRSKFAGKYVTRQEPTTEIVSLLTDTWKYSSSGRNVRISWLKKIHQLERL
ncbi:hypothetical protein CCR75_007016 [Bremia lactucae]|uniref:Uncharacterized protein n=1 Tax=Bremia lactucae TaxID=4779 RepID=A0A976FGQ2_BRELC|nr:hypothetical protein CCR75_007016 [Bremia lactucae]